MSDTLPVVTPVMLSLEEIKALIDAAGQGLRYGGGMDYAGVNEALIKLERALP